MIPNFNDLLVDKLDIDFDSVQTHDLAGGFIPILDWSDRENAAIQQSVDAFYERFLNNVSAGRNMTRDEVHEVAKGRIWTGTKAVELGLVDGVGTLHSAIESAAELAGLEEYRLTEYPKVKEPIQRIVDKLSGKSTSTQVWLKKELGQWYPLYQRISELREQNGPMTRLPFEFEIR